MNETSPHRSGYNVRVRRCVERLRLSAAGGSPRSSQRAAADRDGCDRRESGPRHFCPLRSSTRRSMGQLPPTDLLGANRHRRAVQSPRRQFAPLSRAIPRESLRPRDAPDRQSAPARNRPCESQAKALAVWKATHPLRRSVQARKSKRKSPNAFASIALSTHPASTRRRAACRSHVPAMFRALTTRRSARRPIPLERPP